MGGHCTPYSTKRAIRKKVKEETQWETFPVR